MAANYLYKFSSNLEFILTLQILYLHNYVILLREKKGLLYEGF